jgi:transmembrane sensor
MSVDVQAAQWIVRKRNGLAVEEADELARWLEVDDANRDAFERLSMMSDALDRAVQRGAAGAILGEVRLRGEYRRFRQRTLLAAVAVVAIALSAGYWARTKDAAGARLPAPVWAESNSLWKLPDGSIAEMDQGAEIAVRYESGVRKVELLRGEAVFHVEKDPARPFLVLAGRVEVKALGTAFSVRLDPDRVSILVTEGKVWVEDAVLIAGQEGVVDVSGSQAPAIKVRSMSLTEMKSQLAWRIPRLEFDGLALGQAVERMNRQNRLQIRIEDDATRNIRISGAFMPDDPETFARLVAETFNLESVRESANQILLRKK